MIVLYISNIYNILMHKTISITIDDGLLKKVDEKRTDVPRSKFIARALESKLRDLK